MKTIFGILIFNLITLGISSQPDKNKIAWNKDKPLEWKDFKGSINKKSKKYAETYFGFESYQ